MVTPKSRYYQKAKVSNKKYSLKDEVLVTAENEHVDFGAVGFF